MSHFHEKLFRIIEEPIESIVGPKSVNYEEVYRKAPFHAINLDLCDSVAFKPARPGAANYFDVILTLLNIQIQKTNEPWLLFITTRTGPDKIAETNMAGMLEAIQQNLDQSRDFSTSLADLFGDAGQELQEVIDKRRRTNGLEFIELFCVGLGKWLLKVLGSTPPQRALELRPSCYYTVYGATPDMLSLAFLVSCAKPALVDQFRLTAVKASQDSFSEEQLAISIVNEVKNVYDLDERVTGDGALLQELIEDSAKLMSSARFSASAYREWASARVARLTS